MAHPADGPFQDASESATAPSARAAGQGQRLMLYLSESSWWRDRGKRLSRYVMPPIWLRSNREPKVNAIAAVVERRWPRRACRRSFARGDPLGCSRAPVPTMPR